VVGEPLRAGPRAEADRGLQQRAFDEAANAGSLAFVECGEDALNRPHAGAEIANRQADRSWRPVGLAGHVHDPAHALGDQVEAAAPQQMKRIEASRSSASPDFLKGVGASGPWV